MAWLLTTPLIDGDGFGPPNVRARHNLWILVDGTATLEQPEPTRWDRIAACIYGSSPVIIDERLAELLVLVGYGDLLSEVDPASPGSLCPSCGSKSHYREFLELKAAIRDHGPDNRVHVTMDWTGRVTSGLHEAIACEDLGLDWRPYARHADGRSWAEAFGDRPARPVPRLDTAERPGFVAFTGKLAAALHAARTARDRLPEPAERKAIRERAGLTQKAVADLVGCSESAIGHYEAGKRAPSGELLLRYLAALDNLADPQPGTRIDPDFALAAGFTTGSRTEIAAAEARLARKEGEAA